MTASISKEAVEKVKDAIAYYISGREPYNTKDVAQAAITALLESGEIVAKSEVEAEITRALGCFDAAACEGLLEALADVPDDERGVGSLHDLITRRVMFADYYLREALSRLQKKEK